MHVEFDKHKTNRAAIEKRARSLGYEIPAEGLRSWYQENREIYSASCAGLLVLAGWLGQRFRLPELAATALLSPRTSSAAGISRSMPGMLSKKTF
jgi:hypothetical protein